MPKINDKQRDSFADDLLEASLARYRAAEPPVGLEARLLAKLRAAGQTAPRLSWGWLAVGSVLAASLVAAIGLYLVRPGKEPRPAREIAATSRDQKKLVSPAPIAKSPRTWVAEPRHTRGPALGLAPRLEVAPLLPEQFPTPRPLSEQETLLLRFVKEAPQPALMALPAETQPVVDLQVRGLTIPPLEINQLPNPFPGSR
jgi:hypothetical protein